MKSKTIRSSSPKQMSPGKKLFISKILPFMFVVIGAIITYFGIRDLIRSKASMNWPTVQGKVVASSFESRRGTSHHRRSRSQTTYHPEIYYEFSVNGTFFSGNRVAYGSRSSLIRSEVKRIVDRYPKGKIVTVYYMPENPEQCLLEPGQKTELWLLSAVGLCFFMLGSLALVRG